MVRSAGSDGADGRVRNNELVDTAAGKWKDAGNGGGIVEDDSEGQDDDQQQANDSDVSSLLSDSYSATSSDLQDNADTHYVGLDTTKERSWLEKKTHGITPAGIRKELLRKTVR
jgi:hypothetical protein